ncbi:hypothetical protein MSG28_003108 [Choristoneura fumiferana]|uniref:Uncharacterized protein n=1 Tax=Choristoneura fumiferana TaxID=7141 RepID=A0ACC0KDL0_CHOFU|nr:hypothetical protein MSG28_003108 [Choristoneura fumiferana]
MVTHVEIKGFEDFSKYTGSIDDAGPPVYFFFSGEKLPGGDSWCPDCVEVKRIMAKAGAFIANWVFIFE